MPPSRAHPDDPQVDAAPPRGYDQNAVLRSLRAHDRALYHRLLSIEHDAARALRLHAAVAPTLPLFANARAGSWYVPPARAQACAFKSADGHYGQWASSARRPNLHVLRALLRRRGVVVVDATRAGKLVPDALSKTVPIWAAVVTALTRADFALDTRTAGAPCDSHAFARCLDDALHVHPAVPPSERAAIANQLPALAAAWLAADMHAHPLLRAARRAREPPFRCVWTRPARDSWPDGLPPATTLGFLPIVCVSASDAVARGARSHVDAVATSRVCGELFPARPSFPYVQGAGDDEEAWAGGLSPALFWARRAALLCAAPAATDQALLVEKRVCELVEHPPPDLFVDPPLPVWQTGVSVARASRARVEALLATTRGRYDVTLVLGMADPAPRPDGESRGELVCGAAATGTEVGSGRTAGDTRDARSAESAATATVAGEDLATDGGSRVEYFALTDHRGKLEHKYAFGRALGPCLELLRACCVGRAGSALVVCTSRTGDWAAGLAISWLVWHCTPGAPDSSGSDSGSDARKEDPEEEVDDDDDEGGAGIDEIDAAILYRLRYERRDTRGAAGKQTVQAAMLRFSSSFPQMQISRATLKQVNRFFSSAHPSSTVSA